MADIALPFQIECKSTLAFFEPIAAFKHITVAYRYAQDCLSDNAARGFEYRLRNLNTGDVFAVSAYKGWGWGTAA